MPPANNIGFPATSDMVTSTIGVQTSCPTSPTHQNFYNDEDDYDDICPKHFTDIHKCKLEDTFSRKQKPDDIQLQIIAMECNLLYKDVRVSEETFLCYIEFPFFHLDIFHSYHSNPIVFFPIFVCVKLVKT